MKKELKKKNLHCRRRKGKKNHYIPIGSLGKMMINKELKPFGVDFDYVVKNQNIDGKLWCTYYTFKSKEEYENWEKYCLNLLIKKGHFTQWGAEREFAMFNLMYGLKCDYER